METQKMMRYEANKKSAGVAYLLLILFGGLGVHRFYLGKSGSGVVMLLLTLLGIVLSFAGIGFVLIAIVLLWMFFDLFLIPGMTREYNNKLVDMLTA
jgi:TM2 domain-containing membrane protein YozV